MMQFHHRSFFLRNALSLKGLKRVVIKLLDSYYPSRKLVYKRTFSLALPACLETSLAMLAPLPSAMVDIKNCRLLTKFQHLTRK